MYICIYPYKWSIFRPCLRPPARQDLASALRSYGEVRVSELLGAARRARGRPPVNQKLNMTWKILWKSELNLHEFCYSYVWQTGKNPARMELSGARKEVWTEKQHDGKEVWTEFLDLSSTYIGASGYKKKRNENGWDFRAGWFQITQFDNLDIDFNQAGDLTILIHVNHGWDSKNHQTDSFSQARSMTSCDIWHQWVDCCVMQDIGMAELWCRETFQNAWINGRMYL